MSSTEVSAISSSASRSEALALYNILDTPAEDDFDDIVRLASEACGVPISLISLLDGERQWFKAKIGVDATETPISSSICAHAVQQHGVFEIEDATKDTRTAANPLVTGDMNLRFYAGVPLETPEGVALGALCVIDTKPHKLTPAQAHTLKILARQVMIQLTLRRTLRDRAAADMLNKAILESAVDYAIISLDLSGHVTSWNTGAKEILGWTEDEMIGEPAHVFFTDEDTANGIPEKEMGNALLTGRGNDERWHQRKGGTRFWARGEMMPLKSEDGTPSGFIKILRDRTEQRQTIEDLRDRERSLRIALAAGRLGSWELDLSIGELSVSNVFKTTFGRRPEDPFTYDDLRKSVHPDDKDRMAAAVANTIATGTDYDIEYRIVRPDGTNGWVLIRAQLISDENGTPVRMSGVSLDITARKQSETRKVATLELGERLRMLNDVAEISSAAAELIGRVYESQRAGYAAVDVSAEVVTIENDWSEYGDKSLAGTHQMRDFGSFIEDLKAGHVVAINDVRNDPRTLGDTTAMDRIGVRSLLNLPLLEHGRLVALIFVLKDRPYPWTADEIDLLRNMGDRIRAAIARIEAEDQQRVMNLELNHRMKNMLAIVQSIASQTLRGAVDIEVAKAVLSGRLMALAQANDILLGQGQKTTSLIAVVDGALKLHKDQDSRFEIEGAEVNISPKAAVAISMILHELATNAIKYGALSTELGRVSIKWAVHQDGKESMFRFQWTESGGPPVKAPTKTGFGSRLIERGLALAFKGNVSLAYQSDGVTCTISAPLGGLQEDDTPITN